MYNNSNPSNNAPSIYAQVVVFRYSTTTQYGVVYWHDSAITNTPRCLIAYFTNAIPRVNWQEMFLSKGELPTGDANSAAYWKSLPIGHYFYNAPISNNNVTNALSQFAHVTVKRHHFLSPEIEISWIYPMGGRIWHTGCNHTATSVSWTEVLQKGLATKADIGLSNVDNTSDVAKPVSTAQKAYVNSNTLTVEYKNKLIVTASRNWTAPVTAFYKVICIGGGGGGQGTSAPAFTDNQNGYNSALFFGSTPDINNIEVLASGGFSGNHPKTPGVGGQNHIEGTAVSRPGYKIEGSDLRYGSGGSGATTLGFGGAGLYTEKVLKITSGTVCHLLVGAGGVVAGTGSVTAGGNGVIGIYWN